MAKETDDPHRRSEARGVLGCLAWLVALLIAIAIGWTWQSHRGAPLEPDRRPSPPARAEATG
jgi:hypothetical protein